MAEPAGPYPFLKGHGTENDFVLLPDHDAAVHGDLDPVRVAALCDRRAGIGGDGVLRVVRTAAYADAQAFVAPAEAEWFMDYRNSDGSLSEMCGNGIRVFARHLVEEGLVDGSAPIPIGTRAGLKVVRVEGEQITADMGPARLLGDTSVWVGDRMWPAVHVDMGNPHAVAFVGDLADAGALTEPPGHDVDVYPAGVNVEFVVRHPDSGSPSEKEQGHVSMRVHERGSGETRSCGTGACAVAVATGLAAGVRVRDGDTWICRVDVPGGTVHVTLLGDGNPVLLSGPAVIVARGTTAL
ncbi:diaminopimelate epimerase [Nocardioides ferulae]|uniref:diaminopimelate epimerase n=1 Tax=Nocardioides ferulae TaxID=2340821 RepID=UPI000EB1E1F9|nr:diaminopimelate epimerase [Nocardioides ferulae]